MFSPVSTLPFTTEAVRKVTHFKIYDYHAYITVISIHSFMVNK